MSLIRLIGVEIEFLRAMNADQGFVGGGDRQGNPITRLPVGFTGASNETHRARV